MWAPLVRLTDAKASHTADRKPRDHTGSCMSLPIRGSANSGLGDKASVRRSDLPEEGPGRKGADSLLVIEPPRGVVRCTSEELNIKQAASVHRRRLEPLVGIQMPSGAWAF